MRETAQSQGLEQFPVRDATDRLVECQGLTVADNLVHGKSRRLRSGEKKAAESEERVDMNEVSKKCAFKCLFHLIPRERGIFAVKMSNGRGSRACTFCQYADSKNARKNVSMEPSEIIDFRDDGLKTFWIFDNGIVDGRQSISKKSFPPQNVAIAWGGFGC